MAEVDNVPAAQLAAPSSLLEIQRRSFTLAGAQEPAAVQPHEASSGREVKMEAFAAKEQASRHEKTVFKARCK